MSQETKLREALRWALEWIDAVPEDTVLPAMPGFDRDYVNELLATTTSTEQETDVQWAARHLMPFAGRWAGTEPKGDGVTDDTEAIQRLNEPKGQDSHVMPPFAAPAGQHDAHRPAWEYSFIHSSATGRGASRGAAQGRITSDNGCASPAPSAKQEPSIWQGMGTAPTDGTEILIRFPLQGNVKRLANYNTVHNFWMSKGETIFPDSQGCEWTRVPSDAAPSASASPAAPVVAEAKDSAQE